MGVLKKLITRISASLVLIIGVASAEATTSRTSCAVCVPTQACRTVYMAGEEDGQLQVHITGKSFNTVEAYFSNNYYTDTITGESNLHCHSHILLAKPSDYGTFAIRYGRCADQFVAYGFFKKDRQIKITNDPRQISHGDVGLVLGVEPGFPISLSWVSNRLLKVKHGANGSKSLVLKFFGDEGSGYWSVLHGDGSATKVTPTPP